MSWYLFGFLVLVLWVLNGLVLTWTYRWARLRGRAEAYKECAAKEAQASLTCPVEGGPLDGMTYTVSGFVREMVVPILEPGQAASYLGDGRPIPPSSTPAFSQYRYRLVAKFVPDTEPPAPH